jgi:hypothetical protein
MEPARLGSRQGIRNGDQRMLTKRTVFVALALCLALIGDSSGQRSRRNTPAKETPKAEQSTNPDQRGTTSQPISVNVIPTAEQKADSDKKDSEAVIKAADDHKLIEYAWYQVLVGVVTFFIFVLQLVAFSLQARYMRRTVIEMRRTTHTTIRSTRAAQKVPPPRKGATPPSIMPIRSGICRTCIFPTRRSRAGAGQSQQQARLALRSRRRRIRRRLRAGGRQRT